VLLVLLFTFWDNAAQRRAAEIGPEQPAVAGEDGVTVTGFPVPPLDLPHYHGLELADGGDELGRTPLGDSTSADTRKEVTGA